MNRIVSIVLAAGVIVLTLATIFGVISLEKLSKSNDDISAQVGELVESTQQEAPKEIQDKIKEGGYQAVFLDNGQVYFGKLTETSGSYFSLTDVYYLRENGKINIDTASGNDISLVKLGNELHGPEDFMYILKNKVVFVENLKEDGQVVQSIKQFKQAN
jgi:hypothetical protein